MNAGQEPALAPFLDRRAGAELAAQREAFALQRHQRPGDVVGRQAERGGERGFADRTQPFEPAAHNLDERLLRRPGALGMAGRSGDRRIKPGLRPQRRERRQPVGRDPYFSPTIVIPAQAGIQGGELRAAALDPRFRGGDGLRYFQQRRPSLPRQFAEPFGPALSRLRFLRGHETEPGEGVVQLVAVGHLGPRFRLYPRDRLRVEAAQLGGVFRREPAPAHDRLGAALLERRVVEIGVGPRR